MKYLVIGASGQVGKALHRLLRGHDVVGTGHTRATDDLVTLDLADLEAVGRLIRKLRPAGIFVPGGVTAVDWCESHETQARRICVDGTVAVREAAEAVRAHVVHFSTDYVFSGKAGPYREEDPPDPVSAYGRAKFDGERAATRGTILRTSMVYSGDPESKNFHNYVRDALRAGKTVKAFSDQSGSPTYAPSLARAAIEAMDLRFQGLVHLAGPEVLTRLEFARRVARAYGMDETRILPVTSEELPLPAARPKVGGLRVEKARAAFKTPLTPLSGAVVEMAKPN